jgi:hypothetical protein
VALGDIVKTRSAGVQARSLSDVDRRQNRTSVGEALDAEIERDIASGPKLIDGDQVRESISVGCVSVDSAWLNFSSPKSRKAERDLAELRSPWTKDWYRSGSSTSLQGAQHLPIGLPACTCSPSGLACGGSTGHGTCA